MDFSPFYKRLKMTKIPKFPNSPKIQSKTKIPLTKKTIPYYIYTNFSHQTTTAQKNFPHCNKNYSFSFTFLLNFANFYSSSGENSFKFRKFLLNFCKSAKFPHAKSPILPPLEKNLQKICKKFQTLSFV